MRATTLRGKDNQKYEIRIKDSSVYFAIQTSNRKITCLEHNRSEVQLKLIHEYFDLLKNKKELNQQVNFQFCLSQQSQMLSKQPLSSIAEIMKCLTKIQENSIQIQENLTLEEINKIEIEKKFNELSNEHKKSLQYHQKSSLNISQRVAELQKKQKERLLLNPHLQYSSDSQKTTAIALNSVDNLRQQTFTRYSNNQMISQTRNFLSSSIVSEIPYRREDMPFLQKYQDSKAKAIKTFGFFIVIQEQPNSWVLNMQNMFPQKLFIQSQVYPIFTRINWKYLKELNLGNCGIYDNALELILMEVQFPSLQILHLKQNYLINLPNNFEKINKIKVLHLRDNFLHRFYKKVNYLPSLFQCCNLLSQKAVDKLVLIKWQNLQKISISFPSKESVFIQDLKLWNKFISSQFINFPALKQICVETSPAAKSSKNNVQQVVSLLKKASKEFTDDRICITNQLIEPIVVTVNPPVINKKAE